MFFPALKLEDGPAGVADGMTGVTQLPAPIAVAASWDTALAREYGGIVGAVARHSRPCTAAVADEFDAAADHRQRACRRHRRAGRAGHHQPQVRHRCTSMVAGAGNSVGSI